jgi:hypothetical protein
MSSSSTWTVVSPVSPRPKVTSTGPRLSVGKPIAGLHVGLEIDYAWISYATIIDEWEKLLVDDGATPHTLWVEHSREDSRVDKTEAELRADIEEWSRLLDCGFVGLGN